MDSFRSVYFFFYFLSLSGFSFDFKEETICLREAKRGRRLVTTEKTKHKKEMKNKTKSKKMKSKMQTRQTYGGDESLPVEPLVSEIRIRVSRMTYDLCHVHPSSGRKIQKKNRTFEVADSGGVGGETMFY